MIQAAHLALACRAVACSYHLAHCLWLLCTISSSIFTTTPHPHLPIGGAAVMAGSIISSSAAGVREQQVLLTTRGAHAQHLAQQLLLPVEGASQYALLCR